MSDTSGGLGGGADTSQGDMAAANMRKTGFDKLATGPRADRDVSRPSSSTVKVGSSTKDQAAKGAS